MTIENGQISAEIAAHGAELTSLKRSGREYIWSGDPAWWGRHAPILFPFVGKLAADSFRVEGQPYAMKQHGFARDSEFLPTTINAMGGGDGTAGLEKIQLVLANEPGTATYPYRYALSVRYQLAAQGIAAAWEVLNRGAHDMYFQIGAHPGFNLPDYSTEDKVHGFVAFLDAKGQQVSPAVTSALHGGLRRPCAVPIDGLLPITDETFAGDALIFEESQFCKAVLLDKQRRAVLRVDCPQSEAYGIWAPNKKGCPFVCLEPWCGICDAEGFAGDIAEKQYIHRLKPQESYLFSYTITIE